MHMLSSHAALHAVMKSGWSNHKNVQRLHHVHATFEIWPAGHVKRVNIMIYESAKSYQALEPKAVKESRSNFDSCHF